MSFQRKKIILICVAFLLILFGIFLTLKIRNVFNDLKMAVNSKNELITAVNTRDVNKINSAIDSTRGVVSRLENDLDSFRYFSVIPGIRKEFVAANGMILQVNYLLDSADLLIKIANDAGIDFHATNLNFTSPETLRSLDGAIVKNKETIRRLSERGDSILKDNFSESGIKQIKVQQQNIGSYVKTVQQIERLITTTEDGAATLLGLRGEKRYLLMFENSDELRPGGGIISTYGLVKVKDGQTSELFIDHVKNISHIYINPLEKNPAPIQQTMRHQEDLYIYDANWLGDPNEWLGKIYKSWNLQNTPVDGLIVINTKMLEKIVRQHEPIKLPGTIKEFRSGDIVESLDYYFDVQHDLYDQSKYKVLGPLVNELIVKIKSSNPQQLKEFLVNVKEGFHSRDIFVYTPDQVVINSLKNSGIKNEIPVFDGDEFYALEANLGSGKADGRMKRSLAMQVYVQENQPVSIATITQDYTSGVDDFRAGGYYGYLRYFLPLESKLGAFEKFNRVEDEKIVEAGRQVFGNYYSVAIGTKKDVSITYALTDNIARKIKEGKYSLMVRKQGGVEMPFEIKLTIPDSWKKPKIMVSGGKVEYLKEKSLVTWRGVLTKDMQIDIKK